MQHSFYAKLGLSSLDCLNARNDIFSALFFFPFRAVVCRYADVAYVIFTFHLCMFSSTHVMCVHLQCDNMPNCYGVAKETGSIENKCTNNVISKISCSIKRDPLCIDIQLEIS